MRVLFVPYHKYGLAHLIPLVALARKLGKLPIETAFLVSREMVDYARQMEVEYLPIDHQGATQTEVEAYRHFKPGVVVDDLSFSTGKASTTWGIPRIAIQRTGIFPGQLPRNPLHDHSTKLDEARVVETPDGPRPPVEFQERFQAPVKIVPGVRSIEVLPEAVRDDRSYFFAGPLIVEDYMQESPGAPPTRDFGALDRFFEQNRGRDLVYFTHGLSAEAFEPVMDALRWLLESGRAVVTSIPSEELASRFPERFFYAPYLPMHHVCSRVTLAVHHCGSAAYHYPILHEVPSITIGTRCYDREDVALRLEELGASRHVPSPLEAGDFVDRFRDAVDECFADGGRVYRERRERTAQLRQEVVSTSGAFNFPRVLLAAARR